MKTVKSLLPIFIIIITVATFFFAKETAETATKSLNIIINNLFPAIFPFLIVTSLLISFGGADIIGFFLQYISRPLFNISGKTTTLVFLSAFSGFPFAAIYGSQMAKENPEQKKELQGVVNHIFFPSYNIILVTIALAINNGKTALILYISLQITGFVCLFFRNAIVHHDAQEMLSWKEVVSSVNERLNKMKVGKEITNALFSSIKSFIIIGGMVIIFSTLSMLVSLMIPSELYTYVAPLIEISSGALYYINHSSNHTLLIFFFAFSSCSIIFQAASFILDSPLQLSSFIKARFIQAFVGIFIFAILLGIT